MHTTNRNLARRLVQHIIQFVQTLRSVPASHRKGSRLSLRTAVTQYMASQNASASRYPLQGVIFGLCDGDGLLAVLIHSPWNSLLPCIACIESAASQVIQSCKRSSYDPSSRSRYTHSQFHDRTRNRRFCPTAAVQIRECDDGLGSLLAPSSVSRWRINCLARCEFYRVIKKPWAAIKNIADQLIQDLTRRWSDDGKHSAASVFDNLRHYRGGKRSGQKPKEKATAHLSPAVMIGSEFPFAVWANHLPTIALEAC